MSIIEKKKDSDNYKIFNYCLSFIDLLGQREAYRGQGLFTSETDVNALNSIIRDSIYAIDLLQRDAETMIQGAIEGNPDSPFRAKLSEEDKVIWDKMQFTHLTKQHWSDGLVSFVCLADKKVDCPMNGVFDIFGLSGSLFLLGLARNHPIRGAIDIAWGVELHPGEISGAVVAKAYELESEVAQYPRIVISPRTVSFLKAYREKTEEDLFSRYDRELANLCWNMLVQDADGYCILHYLGDTFKEAITQAQHNILYNIALGQVIRQIEQHKTSGNSRLAFRYSYLLSYFKTYPPSTQCKQKQ